MRKLMAEGKGASYQIVRYSRDETKPPKIVKRGLTEAEARMHCNHPRSSGPNWFEGFRLVRVGRRKLNG